MYKTKIEQQQITLHGVVYDRMEILKSTFRDKFPDEFGKEIVSFLQIWFDDEETLELQTSGSTGVPKIIQVQKRAMIHSAWMTCEALSLSSETTALLCLPISAIAGKMMIVRALVSGMNLDYVVPSGHPLEKMHLAPDFVAMVPLQVYNSLQVESDKNLLREIKKLIIGGGFVDDTIVSNIKDFPHDIYVTYGMTETLSHIALRKLTGKDCSDFYYPFSSIKLSSTSEGCLQIVASHLFDNILITNDIVEFKEDGSFKILGRKDNVINTGGVKIQIEQVEQALLPHIQGDFAITSIADSKFGEIVVLLFTQSFNSEIAFSSLSPYQIPKHCYLVSSIPITRTGKIDRVGCKEMAKGKKPF